MEQDVRFPRWLFIPVAASLALFMIEFGPGYAEGAQLMLSGSVDAPFQFRVLFGYLFVPLVSTIGIPVGSWVFWLTVFAMIAFLLEKWLVMWSSPQDAVIWSLCFLVLVLGFTWFIPDGAPASILETLFFLIALHLIRVRQYVWLVPLVLIASLNRETAVFIVFLAFLLTRNYRLGGLLGLVWLITYGALRLYYANAELYYTLPVIWRYNLGGSNLTGFMFGLVLFGWIPVLAIRGYKRAPSALQQIAQVALLYTGAVGVLGIWSELRLFLPPSLLVMPLMIQGVTANRTSAQEVSTSNIVSPGSK